MPFSTTVIIASAAAIVAVLAAILITRAIVKSSASARIAVKDAEIASLKAEASRAEAVYDATLASLKEAHNFALEQQMATLKAEMTAETEKVLKAREEQMEAEAKKTFSEISGSLGKDFREMKESFERNRQSQTEASASLKENLENAVRNLERRTEDIGKKADNLAGALRAEVKSQGIWGEALFENMLEAEGFVCGRDYNREDVVRDDMGFTVHSEEGKGLRPDFVLHYPDNTDVVVDCKVSLAALEDYMSATTDEKRAEAAKRNLADVNAQVDRLARKDYVRYRAKSTRKTLDYVVMFIPNYGALQLAKQSDPDVWRRAFERNVLIVTEETAMPFLRMIRAAWASYDQARSQKLIVEAAQRMLDRVSDFAKAHAEMGRHLAKATEFYESCDAKLRDSGQSIAVSARQVLKLGVPENPSKPLPEVLE